jgi:hypothetical protein
MWDTGGTTYWHTTTNRMTISGWAVSIGLAGNGDSVNVGPDGTYVYIAIGVSYFRTFDTFRINHLY